MARLPVDIAVHVPAEWDTTIKRLKDAQKRGLGRNLTKHMRRAGGRTQDAIKVAVRNTPVKGTPGGGRKQRGGVGLRSLIADSTKLEMKARARRVDAKLYVDLNPFVGPRQTSLPHHLDTAIGWRHPFFGDFTRWYHNPGHPYFFVTIEKHEGDFRDACEKAIDDLLDSIG